MAKKINLNTPPKKTSTSKTGNSNNVAVGSPLKEIVSTSDSAFGSILNPVTPTTTASAPSSSSKISSTMKKGKDGTYSASSSSSSSKKEPKLPTEFIVRPNKDQGQYSAMIKVGVDVEVLKSNGLAPGQLMVVSKPDRPGVVCFAAPLTPLSMDNNVVKIPKRLREMVGLLLGDRVVIKKCPIYPDVALSVEIGIQTEELTDESRAFFKEQVLKVFEDFGILMPGMKFNLRNEQDKPVEAVIVGSASTPDLSVLSISDNKTENSGKSYSNDDDYDENEDETYDYTDSELITPVFLFDKRKTTLIEFTTNMEIKMGQAYPKGQGFESIGGLSKQIDLIKSKIKLPLNHPNLFRRFNNTIPERGFLLYGPSGTGKTMLLRAIAQEMNTHVMTINGPSIVSKYLGETESTLRQIFKEARKYQPSIIFIDEIDALVPRRGADESGEAESRVVSTLLTLMDSLGEKTEGTNRVIVIGATNRPNSIDPALRRPGRFGQEIEIGIPDVDERHEILQLHLRGMPTKLSEDSIQSIAASLHGYVGADIAALVHQCVGNAINRAIADDLDDADMYVTEEDVSKAVLEIRPSAMREIFLETPKVYWTDIGGQEDVKQKLKETVSLPISHPGTFKRLGVHQPKGVLLYGPPGCSKTLTAKALATEAGLNFLAVKGPEIFNKYVGESERAIREIFRKARAAAPSIIFFDEIDALSSSRTGGDDGGSSSDRVVTSLLNEMDGIEALVGVTILAATNRPDVIDSALMRPGRLDRLIYVGPPDFESRKKILEIQMAKMAVEPGLDIDEFAKATEGCSGAEIVQFCQEAGMRAMYENLEIEYICHRHFVEALDTIKRNITPEMLEFYENYNKEGK